MKSREWHTNVIINMKYDLNRKAINSVLVFQFLIDSSYQACGTKSTFIISTAHTVYGVNN